MADIEIIGVEKGVSRYHVKFRLVETTVLNKGKPDEYTDRKILGEGIAPYPPDATPLEIKAKVNEVAANLMKDYKDIEEHKKVVDKITFRPIPIEVDKRGILRKIWDYLFHK